MKKFLSLVLVFAFCLTLAACGGSDKSETPTSPTVPAGDVLVDVEKAGTEEENTTEPSEPVVGDRVPISDVNDFASTDWELGEVAVSELLSENRMPVNTHSVKVSTEYGFGEDSPFTFSMNMLKVKDDITLEILTSMDGKDMLSRVYQVDGESYGYTCVAEGSNVEEHTYKLSKEDSESLVPSDMDDALMFDDDTSSFKSCEYIGLKDGKDAFKLIDNDDVEYYFYLSHVTGWVEAIEVPEADGVAMLINIEYDVTDAPYTNVPDNVEESNTDFMMFIFSQMMMQAGDLMGDADTDAWDVSPSPSNP